LRVFAALALFALAACATGVEPISIAPHLTWRAPRDDGAADRPRLGVGALADARPSQVRVGSRPPLELFLLGVTREGVERTGDDSFDGAVPGAVRGDVIATLARSGTFTSVTETQIDPRVSGGWPSDLALDFVLIGELEEFSGSQWHSFQVTPFRVGLMRDRWGAPEGRVSARFELWSRTGRIWQGRVATRQESTRGGLADAVLEALALNDEVLATRLDAVLRPRTRASRLLEVRVLDACGLGADGVRRLIEQTSAVFAREFDVALVARPEPWTSPSGARNLDALLDAARRVQPPDGGVVLALAPAQQARDFSIGTQRTGLAVPLGAHAVALCPEDGEVSVLTTTHELAHLFGAVHVSEPMSIMNPTSDFDARFFDPLNRRILRELRERNFARPLDAAARARLAAIYREVDVDGALREP
jgi:hypothetical protein